MSVHYYITPFDPIIYRDDPPAKSPSDMVIDVDDFITRLKEMWSYIKIERDTHLMLVTWCIEHGLTSLFDGQEYSFYGRLQNDYQTISLGWPNEFILWYRRYIPETQSLYFFCEVSWESLLLTTATTMKDIEDFLQGNGML